MAGSKFGTLKKLREERSPEELQEEASEEQPTAEPNPLADASSPPRRGRPPGKRSDESYTQVTAYIQKDVHRNVKLVLLQNDDERDFSDLVDELLHEWVERESL